MGFIDTGNKLKDPITKKKIILINAQKLKGLVKIRSPMYVPFNSLNNHGLLKCISISSLKINDKTYHDYLLGISNNILLKDGIDCILNGMEDLW